MTAVKKMSKNSKNGRLSTRTGSATQATHATRFFQSLLAGFSLGLAGGFTLWIFLVPLSGVSYHMGTVTKMSLLTEATERAGILWILCSAGGAAAGGIFALLILSVKKRFPFTIGHLTIASVGIYALALRGFWGAPPQLEGLDAQTIASESTSALPVYSWFIPMILALLAVAVMAYLNGRLPPSKDREKFPYKEVLPVHFCMSLAAAHITLQLPYYASRFKDFFAGLRDIVFILIGY